MTCEIAEGWDNEGELEPLSIQPRTPGIQPGLRRRAGNLLVYEDGYETTSLLYEPDLLAEQYDDILTELGLASATSAKVTLRIPRNQDRELANYNAVIERPANFEFHYWWHDVEFPVTLFEAL